MKVDIKFAGLSAHQLGQLLKTMPAGAEWSVWQDMNDAGLEVVDIPTDVAGHLIDCAMEIE